jgi:5-methylcytosine-specific restriction protein A
LTPQRTETLRSVLEDGTGAAVHVDTDTSQVRTGLTAWFSDLGSRSGPVLSLHPSGLRRHKVSVRFGKFARPCIDQMGAASAERQTTARALLRRAASQGECSIAPDQKIDEWRVTGSEFAIDILVRDVSSPRDEEAIVRTAETVMVPLMAAMAELIGYEDEEPEEHDTEGRLTHSVVTRRERSARNRLLCLSIHGHRCAACGLEPGDLYGDAGSIIEVHHLEPVSMLSEPRPYDPAIDLVPLCPNCHRAVHTRRPVPWTVEDIRRKLGHGPA